MTVRCKFRVNAIKRTEGSRRKRAADGAYAVDDRGHAVYEPCEHWTVSMSPVYGNGDPNHENTRFWDASPAGTFELTTVNKAAVDQLDLGAEVYIDITVAPKA
jgi:hypothetical protein